MLCRSVGMYFPLKINQMFKPNYKTKFITFIGTDEDVEHPEWDRTAWDSRSGTLGVKLSEWDSRSGTLGVGLSEWDSRSGTLGVGLSEWDSRSGTLGVGLSDFGVKLYGGAVQNRTLSC